ncbi:hypothetical protein AB0K68_36065 [Streptomyces sp. NPDC050698]
MLWAAAHGLKDVLPHVSYELAHHPDVEQRMHEEIGSVLQGRQGPRAADPLGGDRRSRGPARGHRARGRPRVGIPSAPTAATPSPPRRRHRWVYAGGTGQTIAEQVVGPAATWPAGERSKTPPLTRTPWCDAAGPGQPNTTDRTIAPGIRPTALHRRRLQSGERRYNLGMARNGRWATYP